MTERGSGREHSEKHYRNADYEDAPNAAPSTLRAVRASVTRRVDAIKAHTDATLAVIDDAIGDAKAFSAPRPEPERHRSEPENEEVTARLGRPQEKLAATAILIVQEELDFPPDTQAA